jgi:hypothetical protein
MLVIRKSIKDLDYWKKRLIAALKIDQVEKSIEDIPEARIEKARGYAPGTIREWGGKKYKKLSSGKWMRTYTGTGERGERQAIRNVMNKIQKAETMADLVKIVSANRERFVDESGKQLPIVKEFIDSSRSTETGKKKIDVKKESKQVKTNDSLSPIRDKYHSGKSVTGDNDDIFVGKEEIPGTWKLVEADTPSASHDETSFNKTEGFPTNKDGSTINDRDYEKDKDAQLAVIDIASEYDGRAVSFDSPVIVSPDGVVISGNNRTMSSKIAARKGTDKKYIEALKKRAKKFGFNPRDVDKFKNPRVVFEMDNKGNYSTKEFSKFNETSTKTMSPIESAVKMSKIITTDIVKGVSNKIDEFDTMGELYADKKAVNDVFRSLEMGGIVNQFTRPQYVTEDGITGAGKEFLETVLIGSVVNEKNIRGLGNNKALRKKLVRAIVPLIENKAMGGYSVSDELNNAIDIHNQVRASKEIESVSEFAKQSNMFEETNDVSTELAKKMDMKEKDFAGFMNNMNGNLEVGASGQADIFFGDVESKDDILKRMLKLGKSIGDTMRYVMRKSKDLNYWKKKLLEILKGQSVEKSLETILFPGIMIKSLPTNTQKMLIKARGYSVGTIREWGGKKYKKISPKKWVLTYSGTGSRGEKQAIRNVMRNIQNAKTMDELSEIIDKNMKRFKDESGHTLPVVKEFMNAARGTEPGSKNKPKDISSLNVGDSATFTPKKGVKNRSNIEGIVTSIDKGSDGTISRISVMDKPNVNLEYYDLSKIKGEVNEKGDIVDKKEKQSDISKYDKMIKDSGHKDDVILSNLMTTIKDSKERIRTGSLPSGNVMQDYQREALKNNIEIAKKRIEKRIEGFKNTGDDSVSKKIKERHPIFNTATQKQKDKIVNIVTEGKSQVFDMVPLPGGKIQATLYNDKQDINIYNISSTGIVKDVTPKKKLNTHTE